MVLYCIDISLEVVRHSLAKAQAFVALQRSKSGATGTPLAGERPRSRTPSALPGACQTKLLGSKWLVLFGYRI